jgi:uncharacterized protein YjbJ (UPF0337 family)
MLNRSTPVAVGCGLKFASSEFMKQSTKDQITGKIHEVKGDAKEKAGQIANNPDLTTEGQTEKLAGTIRKKVGQIEKVFEK